MTSQTTANTDIQSRLAAAAFGLIALALCLMLHLYWGIQHDAVQYTMQGLAHLRPDLYSTDVYLRFGSQDQFTVFGPVYAAVIKMFGVDHAAVLLTLLSQLAICLAAWNLARCLMPANMSLLAIALLGMLELPYGAGGTFHVIEDFLTPRLLSEALVLWAVAAWLRNRGWWCVALLAIAALVHPIMASAGLVCLVWLQWIGSHPRTAVAAAALALTGLILFSTTAAGLSARFDADWLSLAVGRAPYLTLSNWSSLDLSRNLPQLTTLCVVALTATDPILRRLSIAGIGIALGGLLFTWVGGDWLHFVLVIQAQPWRWLWLTAVLGTIMLPPIMQHLWRRDRLGRAAFGLLLTTYLFEDEVYAPFVAVLAIGVAALSVRATLVIDRRQQTLILWGALGLLLIGVAWDIANRFIYAQIPYLNFAGKFSLIRRVTRSSFLPPLAVILIWWAVFQRPTLARLRVMTVCGSIAVLAVLPTAVLQWSSMVFPRSDYETFAGWRHRIPPGAEVLWAERPLQAWILLERPNYYSDAQFSTALFARAAAIAMREHFIAARPFLVSEGQAAPDPDDSANPNPLLATVCARTGVQYIVTHHTFDVAPVDSLPPTTAPPYHGLKLYQCVVRPGAGPTIRVGS